ncbi:MAG: hypothetical protein ACJ8KU_00030 [Chthoniobacterales bacterium]
MPSPIGTRTRIVQFVCAAAVMLAPFHLSTRVVASPVDEICRAVVVAGETDAASASTPQFLRAFRAVISGASRGSAAQYVAAAVHLRPNLAAEITSIALSTLLEADKTLTAGDVHLVAAITQAGKRAASGIAASTTAAPRTPHADGRDRFGRLNGEAVADSRDLPTARAESMTWGFVVANLQQRLRHRDRDDVRSPEKKPHDYAD